MLFLRLILYIIVFLFAKYPKLRWETPFLAEEDRFAWIVVYLVKLFTFIPSFRNKCFSSSIWDYCDRKTYMHNNQIVYK